MSFEQAAFAQSSRTNWTAKAGLRDWAEVAGACLAA
jgi:hypothetical protein